MHERFGQHIEDGLDRLGHRIERSKKPLDRGAIERQIGRLLERNSRAAGGFSISINEDATHPAGLKLTWQHRPEWQDWARLSEGVYILRTNIAQWSDEELWHTYIQLTEVGRHGGCWVGVTSAGPGVAQRQHGELSAGARAPGHRIEVRTRHFRRYGNTAWRAADWKH